MTSQSSCLSSGPACAWHPVQASAACALISCHACPKFTKPSVWDTDVGIWSCGEHVVASETYHNIQANKGTCLADCSLSANPLALPSQYYYQVSDWSSCSDACDGGFQTRSITCHSSQDGGYLTSFFRFFYTAPDIACIASLLASCSGHSRRLYGIILHRSPPCLFQMA